MAPMNPGLSAPNGYSQDGFIPFLERVIEKARSLTSRKVLLRLDSAHYALDTRVALAGQGNSSLMKG